MLLNFLSQISWQFHPVDIRILTKHLFYTIVMNYSLHAFNTEDYKAEEYKRNNHNRGHWLDGLFHKNDGYKTPVVINPKRHDGNIDMPNENKLAKDRLISLFLNSDNKKNTTFTQINEKNSVHSIKVILNGHKIEDKWKELISKWRDIEKDIKDDFIDNLKNKIKKIWQDKYEYKRRSDDDLEFDVAVSYLAYKTIKTSRYDDFNSRYLLKPEKDKKRTYVSCDELSVLINEIDENRTHITFRIRQTLAFLKFRHIGANTYKIDEFANVVINNTDNQGVVKWRLIDLIPPQCFDTDIMLMDNDRDEGTPFSFYKLSSGERQLVYTMSTMLYHIRNLDSIEEDDKQRLRYNHVYLVLDEIELYFHPELQRQFVKTLIYNIQSMNFDIESVNILLATHSPFILSDVPKSNVLFLKEGRSVSDNSRENTFGANIHTLLQNGFFLNGVAIGNFAKDKINDMFSRLQGGKVTDRLYKEILLVGEPFIRSQLLKMYNDQNSSNLQNEIRELREEIEKLKRRGYDKD